MITVYTDGSCNNKTKQNGGYGIVLLYNGYEKHISGGSYCFTTSSRMEVRAVLEAFKLIKNKSLPITLYCDNEYVVKSIQLKWVYRWESESWICKEGLRPNSDLWKQMLIELRMFDLEPSLVWVRGHNGNKYNEICDKLASIGAKSENLIKDF